MFASPAARSGELLMDLPHARRQDAIMSASQDIVASLAKATDISELDRAFAARIETLGYHSAGYLRVFGNGHFHRAEYLFGNTAPGWAERYQTKQYCFVDPVVTASCRSSGAFTLDEVAANSRTGAPILADSRMHGLF